MNTRRRQYLLTLVAALGGVLLFAYAVHRVGTAPILSSIRNVGWGFVVILALAGLRFVARTQAWRQCWPNGSRLSFGQALTAFLAGDAIGNMTPLGLAASEPAKVYLTRQHVATAESVSSLALDNLVYSGSVIAIIGLGILVMIGTVRLPPVWQEGALATLIVLALAAVLGWRLMSTRGVAATGGARWWLRVQRLHDSIAQFAAANSRGLWRAFTFDIAFHLLAVAEAYLTLRWLLGDHSPTLSQAVVFEALNRAITVVFKFVPFRVGVDEAVSGAFAPLLAVNPMTGVSLAVVRKVRTLFWAGVGVGIIAAHPVRGARLTDPPGTASVHRT